MTSDDRPVVVDMFCGSGGESQGIDWSAQRAGVDIEMYAINNWQRAIETHQANFPDAEHICRDVQDIEPASLLPGRHVALLWASPACTHFSVARGGKPMDDQSRVTPFPERYIFTGGRADVVRQIGNAVCPKVAEALTSAYMVELAGGVGA